MDNQGLAIALGLVFGYSLLSANNNQSGSSSSDNTSSGNSSNNTNENGSTDSNSPPPKPTNYNIPAFLKTIQYAEGTFNQPDPYAITYGYEHTIRNFSDHPAITGEWLGKVLPDRYCIAVNLPVGCRSTAAGAFQFLKPTWEDIKRTNQGIRFDNYGQNLGAIELIRRRGAILDVENGRFQTAINKVNRVWASLPNSPYGQPTRSMSELEQFYLAEGGLFYPV